MICGNLFISPCHSQHLSPPAGKRREAKDGKINRFEVHTFWGYHGNLLSTHAPASSPNVCPRDSSKSWNEPLDLTQPQERRLPSLSTLPRPSQAADMKRTQSFGSGQSLRRSFNYHLPFPSPEHPSGPGSRVSRL